MWRAQIRFFLAPARRCFLYAIVVSLLEHCRCCCCCCCFVHQLVFNTFTISFPFILSSFSTTVLQSSSIMLHKTSHSSCFSVFVIYNQPLSFLSYVVACVCLFAWGGAPSPLSRMLYICMYVIVIVVLGPHIFLGCPERQAADYFYSLLSLCSNFYSFYFIFKCYSSCCSYWASCRLSLVGWLAGRSLYLIVHRW